MVPSQQEEPERLSGDSLRYGLEETSFAKSRKEQKRLPSKDTHIGRV